jgi:nucleoside-diphosphate-sugar epimerase
MKYLLVGGAGFIGSHVFNQLKHNNKVNIIDNFDCYNIMPSSKYQKLLQLRLGNDLKNVYSIHISDRDKVSAAIKRIKPDVVIHLAAYPRAALVSQYPEQGISTMTVGLHNVLSACRGIASHFVYISSSMVYGDFPAEPPTENDPCNPTSAYGIYKLAGEQLCRLWAETSGGTVTVIRPSAVYGPMDVTERVISLFFKSAIENKELNVCGAGETLDFTYIDDITQGIVQAATRRVPGTFNVTSGHPQTLLHAAETIIELVGAGHIKINPRDASYPKRGGLNIASAKEHLGLPDGTPLEKGLTLYYDWLKTNSI